MTAPAAPCCEVCSAPTGDGALLCRTHEGRLAAELRAVVGDDVPGHSGPRREVEREPGPWHDGVRTPEATPSDPDPAPWPDERTQFLPSADVGLAAELDRTRTRRDRAGVQDGARSGVERGLSWNERAAQVAEDLTLTLHGWVQELAAANEDPRDPASSVDGSDSVSSARWLLRNMGTLRRHPAAANAYDELVRVITLVRRTIDLPATARTFFVGPCPDLVPDDGTPCAGEVWAYIAAVAGETSWLRCSAYPNHQWDTTRWLRAGRLILARRAQLRRSSRPMA